MKKHLAIFVTDGTELIGIKNVNDFVWETFSWFEDHFFMSILNEVLEPQSPAKIVFGAKQLPRTWVGAKPFILSYYRFFLLLENMMNIPPPIDRILDREFSEFYKYSLKTSIEKLLELKDNLQGIYKVVPDEVFVILMLKPVFFIK